MKNNYSTFINFGTPLNPQTSPTDLSNPLTYCIFPTLSEQFLHGSSTAGLLYGTDNTYCMNFMTEYCKNEWDPYCETYKSINIDSYFPNTAVIDTYAFQAAQAFLRNNHPSQGEMLLRNVVQRTFIEYPGISYYETPFDSNTANSPSIKIYANYTTIPSKLIHLDQIPVNPIVSQMLSYPNVCFDILARFYLGILRNEPNIQYILNYEPLLSFLKRNEQILFVFTQFAREKSPSFL
jgi:hypothetical protein